MRKRIRQPAISASPKISPLTEAVREQVSGKHLVAAALIGGALIMPPPAVAQEALEEIIVSAQKRDENLQDVPISIVALDSTALREQAIESFEDYALTLSNVSFKSFGYPGSATVYFRGASDGGDGNSSGSTPSVCIYMDEQPVTDIAANLDIHIYDMARIEALAGPQGTLYGASCQSGSLRIITNKPDPSEFSAGFDVGYFDTDGGDTSSSVEAFMNLPLSDNAAIRLVGWSVNEGGWIDNVGGGVRTYDYPGVTLTNDDMAEANFNELDKSGMRAALGIDLNDNWTLQAGVIYQELDTQGIWEIDHVNFDAEDQSIQRFNPDSSSDEFTQISLTLEGEIGNHRLTYAGSVLDRESYYESDYSAYGDYVYWVYFYSCNFGYIDEDECTTINEIATRENQYDRTTHELRLQSLGDGRLQYTVGAFLQSNEHKYLQLWRQPGMVPSVSVPGYATDDVWFRTDQNRQLDQTAIFGELSFDISETVRATIGARWFDEEADLQGVVGWGPSAFDANYGTPAADPFAQDTFVDLTDSTSDTIFKANIAWDVGDDAMIYATWSEGYRPGGINRDPALLVTAGTQIWVPDILTNMELGWKSTLVDGRIRFNGAVYFMTWDDIQYTVYDGSLSFCCGSTYNLNTAEISGIEADITYLASEGLTLSTSFAFNDAETTGDFILPSGGLAVPSGTSLPNVPEFKINVVARYEFQLGDANSYAQATWNYTDSSASEITDSSFPQSDYSILNLRAGVDLGGWGADIFINNAGDEIAQYYVHPRPYAPSTVTNRPRSVGAKLWMRF